MADRITLTPLRELIIDLRRVCAAEPPIHPHAWYPASVFELDNQEPLDPDEGGLGIAFTGAMHRFLKTSAPRWDSAPNPRHRPGTASIMAASDWCHAEHSTHHRPGRSRSLCAQMLYEVAIFGREPEELALSRGLTIERVERMLMAALCYAREWRIDCQARYALVAGELEPTPERRRPPAA